MLLCCTRSTRTLILTNRYYVKIGNQLWYFCNRLFFNIYFLKKDINIITTSSEIAANYLLEELHSAVVLTLGGGEGLADELNKLGLRSIAIENASTEEIIAAWGNSAKLPLLIGWTDNFNYDSATKILQAAPSIGCVFATDNDRLFSSDTGNYPGTSWISGSVSNLLQKNITNLGKPTPLSLQYVLRKIGSLPKSTLLSAITLSLI